MSALLSQLEGRERRAECLRNDAAMTDDAYTGVRCTCVITGCRAGPGCPHYCEHCRKHIEHARAKSTAARAAFFAECEAEARDVMRNRSEK